MAAPEQRTFSEQEVQLWPRVSWSPSFAITFSDLKASLPAAPCFQRAARPPRKTTCPALPLYKSLELEVCRRRKKGAFHAVSTREAQDRKAVVACTRVGSHISAPRRPKRKQAG